MYRNGGCIMNSNNGKVKPFGIKDKLGYMFGDFGNDFTFLLSAMFLLSSIQMLWEFQQHL